MCWADSTPRPSDGKNSAGAAPRQRASSIHAYSSGVSSTITFPSTEPYGSGAPLVRRVRRVSSVVRHGFRQDVAPAPTGDRLLDARESRKAPEFVSPFGEDPERTGRADRHQPPGYPRSRSAHPRATIRSGARRYPDPSSDEEHVNGHR